MTGKGIMKAATAGSMVARVSHRCVQLLATAAFIALVGTGAWPPGTSAAASAARPFSQAKHRTSSFGSALVGSAPVGKGPAEVAVDNSTHTIYVTNGSNDDGPNAGGDTVSVISDRHCNADDVSRCKGPWPTIKVGDLPSSVAIDQKTDTVYVTDGGDNAVSVFNGATCNATAHSGCGQHPATVPVGLGPLGVFADPANHTIYVANSNNIAGSGSTTVSMINSATCKGTSLSRCPTAPPPTVNIGADPDNVDVNLATHTVYVTDLSVPTGYNGWAVFNASTCNARVQSGCGTIGRIAGDPIGPFAAEVDPVNNTLYTANWDNTISVFNLRHCDAADLAGCSALKAGTVAPVPYVGFDHDIRLAIDESLHTAYVVYHKDDSLFLVNTATCNGTHLRACSRLRPPTIHTGANPEGIVLDPGTQTLYVADEVGDEVSVISASRCNVGNTGGCARPAPSMRVPQPGALASDHAVGTMYVTSGARDIRMINTRRCNIRHLAGCARMSPDFSVGLGPEGIAVDGKTHTIYVASSGSGSTGTVQVIDDRTCNAVIQSGCANQHVLRVPGGHPDGIAVDARTDTVYVPTITSSGDNLLSVFNGAGCNTTRTGGCGQLPSTLQVASSAGGDSSLSVAVDAATNTVYATNLILGNPFVGDSLYVINGRTCDALHHSGCGQTPVTIRVGYNPWGVGVDQGTDTIYTANIANGEGPGTVSVINGATCNGTDHAGCSQVPVKVRAGFGAAGLAVDSATGTVYVSNIQDTSLSVINGNSCNGTDHRGCHRTAAKVAVGNYPDAIGIDPAAGTAYVANLDNTISIIGTDAKG